MIEKLDEDFENEEFNYRAQKEFLRNKIRASRKKRNEKKRKRIQRRKKIRKWIRNTPTKSIKVTRKFLKKVVEPQVLVSAITAFIIFKSTIVDQKKFAQLEQEIQDIREQQESTPRTLFHAMKSTCRENWPKIILGGGTILVPVGKHFYKNWQVKQELHQTKGELIQTQNKLDKSQEETVKVRVESTAKLNQVQKDHKITISKLHVTLNHLNSQAMESAKRETFYRNEIESCKIQLAEGIDERNLLNKEVEYLSDVTQQQNEEISQAQVEVKSLEIELSDAETEQAEIKTKLEKVKNENRFFKWETKKLQKELKKVDAHRKELKNDLFLEVKHNNKLTVKKQQLETDLNTLFENQQRAENKIKSLRAQKDKNSIQLKKAVEDTNRYAMQMDKARYEINEFEKKDSKNQRQVNLLNQQVSKLDQQISKLEKIIVQKDQTNYNLEQEIEYQKQLLNKNILENDDLHLDLIDAKKDLKTAYGDHKNELEKIISNTEKTIGENPRRYSKLKTELEKQEKKLNKSYDEQDDLMYEIQTLKNNAEMKEKSYFSRLQSERKQQEEYINNISSSQNNLINEILDQQEIDQKKHWWQKIPVKLSPRVSVNAKQERSKERDSYFYPSWANEQPLPQKVRERYSYKRKRWEVIDQND